MRLVLSLLFLVTLVGCGDQTEPTADPGADRACRKAWENLRQTQGENGNPAETGTALAAVYDDEARVTTDLSRNATADDCPARLDEQTARFDRFIDLSSAQYDNDMRVQLRWAEFDLKHAIATRDYDPLPPDLADSFDVLRSHAAAAGTAIEPQLEALATVDLGDPVAIAAAVDAVESAAAQDPDVRACRQALVVIGDHELSEE